MNKSVRINLLVITIVVALFVFAGLWFTRPGVSDDIIERARARQSEPLMEITEPLRTKSVEEPVDTTQLAREVRQAIEPGLTESIRRSLLADDDFIEEVTSRAFVDAVVPHYDYQAEIDELSGALQLSLLEQLEGLDEAAALKLIEEVVTAQTPMVVDRVLNTLEENKDYIIAIARAELSDLISEDEIVDLYLENRAALVYDIVPMILADMEAIQKGEEVPSKALAEEAMAERAARAAAEKAALEQAAAEKAAIPSVPVVTVAVEEAVVVVPEETAPEVVLPAAPLVPGAPSVLAVRVEPVVIPEPVVEEFVISVIVEEPVEEEVLEEPVVAEIAEPVVEEVVEPVVEEVVEPVVVVPAAPEIVEPVVTKAVEPVVEPVELTTEEAYEVERQRLRNAEITKYLKLIGEISE